MAHLTTKITIQPGGNLIGWPITAPEMTNEAFLDDLAVKGFEPQSIYRWFGGTWKSHLYQSPAEIWAMEGGKGYHVWALKGGPYELPGGALSGHEHDCPVGQHWDTAQAKCVADTPGFNFDFTKITEWAQAHPILAGAGILGGVLLLGGGGRRFR